MSLVDGPLCLDVTRTVSRAGAGAPSGVDRVERAYIREALKSESSFFVSRVLGGFVLLQSEEMSRFLELADSEEGLDQPDMISRLARKQTSGQQQAETTVRRVGSSFIRRPKLASLLKKHLPDGFTFLSVGHSNQSSSVYKSVKAGGAAKIATLLHDVIPLDYPEFTRPDAVSRFEAQLRTIAGESDLLIHNSTHTAERARYWLGRMQISCRDVVALLGVDPLPTPLIENRSHVEDRPSFVMLGTIEPRKNHLLLLSVWRRFFDTLPFEKQPLLHIVGRRGWENENIVDILERAPFMGRSVFEHGFISDEQLSKLLGSATALLFPSFAEGFGYPLIEALQMKKNVICSPLPPFKEIAGDLPHYVDPLDGIGWAEAIQSLASGNAHKLELDLGSMALPSWQNHFREVSKALAALNPLDNTQG